MMKLQFIIISFLVFISCISATPILNRKIREADFETNTLEAKLLQSNLQTLNARADEIPLSRGEEFTYGIGGTFIFKSTAANGRNVVRITQNRPVQVSFS